MNNYDFVSRYYQEHDRLTQAWQAAYARYQNAEGALGKVLVLFSNKDPRLEPQSAHAAIVRVKQAWSELHQIEEQLVALLDEVDGAIHR